jgi:hypothetical protein
VFVKAIFLVEKEMDKPGYFLRCRSNDHVLVKTRNGVGRSKKREKAAVNETFARNADHSRMAGPAARQVVGCIAER